MALSSTIPIVIGATSCYFALRIAPELLTLPVLTVTVCTLTSVVVEEVIAEAHEGDTSRLGPILLTTGFAILALVSVYVG